MVLARAMETHPTLARYRVSPVHESVLAGGRALELWLPAASAWLSGFRVRAPPQPRVWADQNDPLVITVAVYEVAPPRLDLRDLRELELEGLGVPTPRFVASFVVPAVREGSMLHFDFVDAVRLEFPPPAAPAREVLHKLVGL
jgi:hypothetical protein